MSKFFIAWTIIIPDTLQCESYVLELNGSRSEPFVANSNIQTLTPIIETCKIRGELVGFDSSHHSSSVATFDISFGQQCKVGDVFQSKDRLVQLEIFEIVTSCNLDSIWALRSFG